MATPERISASAGVGQKRGGGGGLYVPNQNGHGIRVFGSKAEQASVHYHWAMAHLQRPQNYLRPARRTISNSPAVARETWAQLGEKEEGSNRLCHCRCTQETSIEVARCC